MRKLNKFQMDIYLREEEIKALRDKMTNYETFKHRFNMKTKEANSLLDRVAELSTKNGDLEE